MSLEASNNITYSPEDGVEKLHLCRESFLQGFLEAYPNLEPGRLAEAFYKGFEKAAEPEGISAVNFFEHYARPEQFARELSRLVLGLPAFRQPQFDRLDIFLGFRKTTMSEKAFRQAMVPLIRLVNQALAAAQIYSPDTFNNRELAENHSVLSKFDVQRPPTLEVHMAEMAVELRKLANEGQIDQGEDVNRLCALEENIQTMVLAKRFFGRPGPYTIIPALRHPSGKSGILTYSPAERIALLEHQLACFQSLLNTYIRTDLNRKSGTSALAPVIIVGEKIPREPAVTLEAPPDYQSGALQISAAANQVIDPPPSRKFIATSEKYTALLANLMKVSSRITELQGGLLDNGTIEVMRNDAEVSAGRSGEARNALQEAVNQIFEHRHSWFSLTENSRVSALRQKSLQILAGVQMRLVEIECEDIIEPLEWQEIPYSDNRASMPVDNIHNMSDELEEIITNLMADELRLTEQLYRAQKIKEIYDAKLEKIKQAVAALIAYLQSPAANSIIEIHSRVKNSTSNVG